MSKEPDRFAIIVGISEYKNPTLNLRFADRDAEELCKLIKKPDRGNFPEKNIKMIQNQDASYAKIRWALRTFLKEPKEDDLVLIYFSCHGARDPGRLEDCYLLPHDADPDDIASTALPMDDLNNCITRTLKSNKVVVIIDACHGAAVGPPGARSALEGLAATMNPYLVKLNEAKPGTAIISSSREDEKSFEDEKFGSEAWGQGHGVFTYHLLEGLTGKAADSNGYITVKALYDYVYEKVRADTNGKQNPTLLEQKRGPDLPLAYLSDIAEEHYSLGENLSELGQVIGDLGRLKSAAGEFEQAIKLNEEFDRKGTFQDGRIQMARSFLAQQAHNEIIKVLEPAVDSGIKLLPGIHFYLGIAKARLWDYEGAIKSLEQFLSESPEDGNAGWVSKYVAYLKSRRRVKKHALLIGVSDLTIKESRNAKIMSLEGSPRNDVQLLNDIMVEKFGFQEQYVHRLTGVFATKQSLKKKFEVMKQASSNDDEVVIYVSAPIFSVKDEHNNNVAIIPMFDSEETTDGKIVNGVRLAELHDLIKDLNPRNKTLIIDGEPGPILNDQSIGKLSYNFLIGASPGERFHIFRASSGLTYGYFTYHFADTLRTISPQKLAFETLVHTLSQNLRNQKGIFTQIPFFVAGDKSALLFGGIDYYQTLLDFSIRRNYSGVLDSDLDRIKQILTDTGLDFPDVLFSLARAWVFKDQYKKALDELLVLKNHSKDINPELELWLGISRTGLRSYPEAIESFEKCNLWNDRELMQEKFSRIRQMIVNGMAIKGKNAVIVGIDKYRSTVGTDGSDGLPEQLEGSKNDIEMLEHLLIEKFEFQIKDVHKLTGNDVSETSLKMKFSNLLKQSKEGNIGLFYFSGYCLITRDGAYILGPYGLEDAIPLNDLSEIATREEYASVISVIDARWIMHDSFQKLADDEKTDLLGILLKRIGQITIFSSPLQEDIPNQLVRGESSFPSIVDPTKSIPHGILSYHLLKELNELKDKQRYTYAQLLQKISATIQPIVLGSDLDNSIFGKFMADSTIMSSLKRLVIQTIADSTITNQKKVNSRMRDVNPEGHLNLGIALAEMGEEREAIRTIEKAIRQMDDNFPEASYHLGRIQFEVKDDLFSAISELSKAKDADNHAAYYYLAEAKRALIGRIGVSEVVRLYRKYLYYGAPLGHQEEVRKFLNGELGWGIFDPSIGDHNQ